jgi:hypothetical protein
VTSILIAAAISVYSRTSHLLGSYGRQQIPYYAKGFGERYSRMIPMITTKLKAKMISLGQK